MKTKNNPKPCKGCRMIAGCMCPDVQGHTPGPWTVESDGSSVSFGGQVVITAPIYDEGSRDEEKANARLIAAAPDLLAAAVAIMSAIDTDETSGRKLSGLTPAMSRARIALRAAISDASEGK